MRHRGKTWGGAAPCSTIDILVAEIPGKAWGGCTMFSPEKENGVLLFLREYDSGMWLLKNAHRKKRCAKKMCKVQVDQI